MRKLVLILLLIIISLFAQNLPDVWSQSYCTYDIAEVHAPGEYSLGFAIDNFALYNGGADTAAYDTRRFDVFAKLGLFKNTEFEIKYSSPTCGLIAGKCHVDARVIDVAFKLGFGYMKGTRIGHITDYVYDFYPTLILSKQLSKTIKLYYAPKIIYSIHPRDRQEHSDREPRKIFQYGHGIGLSIGDGFILMPESNWLFADNMGVRYAVNQFGIGVNLKINH